MNVAGKRRDGVSVVKRFPKVIMGLRDTAGLSLRDAEEVTNINFKTIHLWERGVTEPRPHTLNKYLTALQKHGVEINKGEVLSLLGRGRKHRMSSNPA